MSVRDMYPFGEYLYRKIEGATSWPKGKSPDDIMYLTLSALFAENSEERNLIWSANTGCMIRSASAFKAIICDHYKVPEATFTAAFEKAAGDARLLW